MDTEILYLLFMIMQRVCIVILVQIYLYDALILLSCDTATSS